MKKVLCSAVREQAEFYSDFTNKKLVNGQDITVTIDCNYGSIFDGTTLELHIDDSDLDSLLQFLEQKLINKNLIHSFTQ